MNLCPRELEKGLLLNLGFVSQKRLARGLRLNAPEVCALIASQIIEFARDGHSVSECMDMGRQLLGFNQVIPGVECLVNEVQVETTFGDGTKLVTVHNPLSLEDGNLALALHGSFLPVPTLDVFHTQSASNQQIGDSPELPGEFFPGEGKIAINSGRECVKLTVQNKDDRPIQVGSHYHFVEANCHLEFDRSKAIGKRLNIASGTAVRFEPGQQRVVELVNIAGNGVIKGGNNLAMGVTLAKVNQRRTEIMENVKERGFLHREEKNPSLGNSFLSSGVQLPRELYFRMYGPTVGDRIRLGDTSLVIEIEYDFCVYGDECKFGGGKVLREGMGQHGGSRDCETLDCLLTNCIILDHTGIYKADIGLKNGEIVGIGKGGNPDVMNGVTPNMIVGVNTDTIACEGYIVTAGGLDVHIHYICPQQVDEAISSGVTTFLGGGQGPTTGSCATTCTAGANNVRMMIESTDSLPINFAFTGKGNTSSPEGLTDMIDAGAAGLKLHEDWGTTPAAIDCCLAIAEETDIQVTIHTDTLNESCSVEGTFAAFKNRTIHTYHSEGAGGGHAPDIIRCCGEEYVIPSSTNPTRPFTRNTLDEHLDMLMVCHHLDKNIGEDVSFAESRIRGETIAAEDILHDVGALSIIASDSQAMGRVGEVVTRTWQTADKMKRQRGHLEHDSNNSNSNIKKRIGDRQGVSKLKNAYNSYMTEGENEFDFFSTKHDNFRARRYVSKYTINPAIAHGMSHLIGSIEVGKVADLCVWKPSMFGAKPQMVLKSGVIAYSQMGDANASIPTPEPVMMRPMFGALGKAVYSSCITFVSQSSLDKNIVQKYNNQRRIEPVRQCRNLTKSDMVLNNYCPKVHVDPETYVVTADGLQLHCEHVDWVPLGRRYFMC
eukprot:Nk52_evm3s223 gene=Nk52_evmTU3s223